ncbi:hypothetical protein [Ottowia testudinis]|uniref:Transmembrane protein n=1 Tax=Ottowia testudinis TaxID=2816950 RepID=A0A975CG21_9BURK|nr:hypothetical protein [Ottowia testudinis]QTD44426.1 hypothetical protein J1M35_15155 [Ottowia testudinis]
MLQRLLRALLVPFIGLALIFEEWGWVPLQRVFARLARLPLWARLEQLITRLPPWAALLTFFTPMVLLFPLKLLALYWIGNGHVLLGAALVLAAKVVGTAIVARLFALTQPSLMRLAWFARWYPRWVAWKNGVIAQLKASWYWRAASVTARRGKRLAARAWRRWVTAG